MKDIKKFINPLLPPGEAEHLTEQLLRAKFRRERKAHYARLLQEQHGLTRPNTPAAAGRRRWIIGALAVAASIALLLLLPRLLPAPSAESLALSYLNEEKFEHIGASKGLRDVTAIRAAAIEAYQNDRYEAAIENWSSLLARNQATDEDVFFLALSHLYAGQAAQAIPHLEQLRNRLNDPGGPFYEESRWFLSLSYLTTGQSEAGARLLRSIQPGHWHYDDARQLLSAMSD